MVLKCIEVTNERNEERVKVSKGKGVGLIDQNFIDLKRAEGRKLHTMTLAPAAP